MPAVNECGDTWLLNLWLAGRGGCGHCISLIFLLNAVCGPPHRYFSLIGVYKIKPAIRYSIAK